MGRRPDQSEKQERVTGVDDTACFLQAIADVRPLPAPPPPP
ncbi:DNA mismatch repair protein MutS, partial [Acidithiobacillus ferridurans]|nr:DNA mismatch repair protein MutS [Acidithiobacillus ferridurans]